MAMKIKRIKIKDYQQFKDLDLDLTYPKGHEKQGQPLEKVCFIGQSGTGKTTLLRLIKWYISRERRISENFPLPLPDEGAVSMDFQLSHLVYTLINRAATLDYHAFGQTGKGKKKVSFDQWQQAFDECLKEISPLLINYPPDLMGIPAKPKRDAEQSASGNVNGSGGNIPPDGLQEKMGAGQIIDFAFEDIRETWTLIVADIEEYRKKEILETKKIVSADRPIQEMTKKYSRFEEWKAQNPDPLKKLADEFLDSILLKVGLKVKVDISEHSLDDLSFIEVQALNGVDVARNLWSTGTRQLLLTLIPLYQLKPQNAVILVDEPERSLYPDIQLGIVDEYVKLAPTCQFIFATHSPIIAAAFEPWEIVELKFDDEHTVAYHDLSYDGDNHVDNYKYDPRYLRWDSILMRIFELSKEGGKERIDAMVRLAELNGQIDKLKKEGKFASQEGQKLGDEQLKILEKLDWEYKE